MELTRIIDNIKTLHTVGMLNVNIEEIQFDSRKIKANNLFVAIKGVAVDGHDFIQKAIDLGAKTIIYQKKNFDFIDGITYIQVENSAKVLGQLASNFHQNPSKKLKLIGITGTNGKTTTTTLLYDLFSKLGFCCALISTVENRIGNTIILATHTTPDALSLQLLLAKAVEKGCEYVFMEVSSHGIHQERLEGLDFAVAGFTNITHDHLDYHHTFAEYLQVKKSFFDQLSPKAIAISNIDDKNGLVMLQNTKANKKCYGLKILSDYKAKILETRLDGMLIQIDGKEFWTSLSGAFNAYNLLLVYAVAISLGQKTEEVIQGISALGKVKGRFETIQTAGKITIVVDYAHTPDALENVLKTIQKIRTKNETLYTIFGCGGNRDKDKRPAMAKIACEHSDKVIITSDNPRNENPSDIIQDIKDGVPPQFYYKTISIESREEAIKHAISNASSGDIILIAGKGHENYQEIQGINHYFDDMETAQIIAKKFNK